jgi:hypothetical protein
MRRHVLIPAIRAGMPAALAAALVTISPMPPAGGSIAETITSAYQTGS